VSGQLHEPAALPLRKESSVPIGQEARWDLRAGMDYMEKQPFFNLPDPEIRPLVVQPVGSPYTDCATAATPVLSDGIKIMFVSFMDSFRELNCYTVYCIRNV
jgi:hypothetical protein